MKLFHIAVPKGLNKGRGGHGFVYYNYYHYNGGGVLNGLIKHFKGNSEWERVPPSALLQN